jgi:hypothetical protein
MKKQITSKKRSKLKKWDSANPCCTWHKLWPFQPTYVRLVRLSSAFPLDEREWGTSHRFISITSFLSSLFSNLGPALFFLKKHSLEGYRLSKLPLLSFALTPLLEFPSPRVLKSKKKSDHSLALGIVTRELYGLSIPHALRLASTCRFVHPSVRFGFPWHKQPPPRPIYPTIFAPHRPHFHAASSDYILSLYSPWSHQPSYPADHRDPPPRWPEYRGTQKTLTESKT